MRLLVVIVLSVSTLVACGEGGVDATRAASDAGHAGTWVELPAPPLSPRSERVVVWTGDEVLVIGGSTFTCPPGAGCAAPEEPPLRDGAALDLASNTWRRIADAPVPVRSAATAVLGRDVYLLAATGWAQETELLRYRLDEASWERLPPIGDGGGWYALVAAGDQLVAHPTSHERGQLPDLRYDTSTATWRELPPSPLGRAFDRQMVWADGHLYLFDKELVAQPGSERPSVTRAARLDVATATWERLADSEILATAPWLVDGDTLVNPLLGGADGGEVNNWGRTHPNGGMFDIRRREWLPLPPAPEGALVPAGAYGSTAGLFVGDRGWILDVAGGHWRELPAIDAAPADEVGRTVLAAGRTLVAMGGVRWPSTGGRAQLVNDAWAWRPPEP